MAWDFSTEPEFQQQLDWMRTFVREEIWPVETIFDELGEDGFRRAWERGRGLRPDDVPRLAERITRFAPG